VFGATVAVALVSVPALASATSAAVTSGPRIAVGWGDHSAGALGPVSNTPFPSAVAGLPATVVDVSANEAVAAAVLADGSVWTWGDASGCGMRGDGVLTGIRPQPARVEGLPPTMVQVRVSNSHVLALSSDGSAYSWGCNFRGELGSGAVTHDRPVPGRVTVIGTLPVAEVAAGTGFSMVLRRNGEVFTWGDNTFGELGNGTFTSSLTPVRAGPYGVAHIAAWEGTAIAVRTLALGGAVFTWGDNLNGQLGRNSTETKSAIPMRESARLDNVVQVATNGSTDMAVLSDGTVWGWGFNGSTELTRPNTGPQRVPVPLRPLTGVTQVAFGAPNAACIAVLTDGTVRVWGDNAFGQRGDGTVGGPPIATPVPVTRVHGVTRAAAAFRVTLVIAASVDPPPTA